MGIGLMRPRIPRFGQWRRRSSSPGVADADAIGAIAEADGGGGGMTAPDGATLAAVVATLTVVAPFGRSAGVAKVRGASLLVLGAALVVMLGAAIEDAAALTAGSGETSSDAG